MKKLGGVCALLALLLLPACGRTLENNLTFCNESGGPVGAVEIEGREFRAEGCRADGGPLEQGESLGFLLDPVQGGEVTLKVWDQDHCRVVAQRDFHLDLSGQRRYRVSLGEEQLVLESAGPAA